MTQAAPLALIALALMSLAPLAQAGRPLASDDPSTADFGSCQVEVWGERTRTPAGTERALVTAPACGIAPGVELDASYTRLTPADTVRASAGLALKWVPESARFKTSVGEINFGLHYASSAEHPAGGAWQHTGWETLALGNWSPSAQWSVRANAGVIGDRVSGGTAGLLQLATLWLPREDTQLFVEVQRNSRSAVFGSSTVGAGGRWWLINDRLGLDLSASRSAGLTTWTLGFGVYGLSF
jgi:hypothetical protein